MSNAWRNQFSIPLVGVAGSNGKTTAKEMTATILSKAGACLATRGNLNNHIGVPLTILRLEETDRFAVVEMGANRAGEVAALVRIARPTVGMITNAGAEHLEGFGTLEGVARAEGEMVAGLAPDATAVINADDEFAAMWRNMTPARVVTFGFLKDADFAASDIRTTVGADGFVTRFTLTSPVGRAAIELNMGGRHNVANALAAAAAATAAGATLQHVIAGLSAVRAVAGRLQFKKALSGAWVIDDSYNANPSSMRAGIDVLAELEGRKWLVIGDMAELGQYSDSAHAEVGAYARERGIERLYATGPLSARSVESFGAGAQWFADGKSLAEALAAASPEVRMLIKGSRVNRLERVVEALVGPTRNTGGH
jgi:UDP-N-acetylmuramoyl-tripeptide--D-alanyl-D-alanine ligase